MSHGELGLDWEINMKLNEALYGKRKSQKKRKSTYRKQLNNARRRQKRF